MQKQQEKNISNLVTIINWQGTLQSQKVSSVQFITLFSFGHVALQTHSGGKDGKGYYVSFWPGKCHEWHKDRDDLCQEKIPHFHTRDEDDLASPHHKANEYKIYSLDVDSINKIYEQFVDEGYNWTKLGSSILRRGKDRNCSGLVLYLLKKGGLFKFLNYSNDYSRLLFAVFLATSLFSGTVFWAFYKKTQAQEIANIFELALKASVVGANVLNTIVERYLIEEPFEKIRTISHHLGNQEIPKIIDQYISLGNDELIKNLFENIKLTPSIFDKFLTYFKEINNHSYNILTGTFIVAGISIIFLYLNSQLLLKTITPKDVARLAKALEKLEGKNKIVLGQPQNQKVTAPICNIEKAEHSNNISNENLVIVKIWQRTPQSEKNDFSSSGHLVLQTHSGGKDGEGHYISFWPGKCYGGEQAKSDLCQKTGPHLHDKNKDDLVMSYLPNVYKLYNLDVKSINLAYEKFIKNFDWKALNNRSILYSNKNTKGLTLTLLKAGGIFKLVNYSNDYSRILSMGLFASTICLGMAAYSLCKLSQVPGIDDESNREMTFIAMGDISTVLVFGSQLTFFEKILKVSEQMGHEAISTIARGSIQLNKKLMDELTNNFELTSPILQSFDHLFNEIKSHITGVFLGTVLVSGVSLALIYLNNQFFLKTLEVNDIRRLVQKAEKIDQRNKPLPKDKQALIQRNSLLNSVIKNKGSILGTGLLLATIGFFAYRSVGPKVSQNLLTGITNSLRPKLL